MKMVSLLSDLKNKYYYKNKKKLKYKNGKRKQNHYKFS